MTLFLFYIAEQFVQRRLTNIITIEYNLINAKILVKLIKGNMTRRKPAARLAL